MNNSAVQTVSTARAYEVRHWIRELDCTETELYAAVLAVGHNLNDIRRYRETLAAKGPAHSWFAPCGRAVAEDMRWPVKRTGISAASPAGREAYSRGQSLESNPYVAATLKTEVELWAAGWLKEQAEQTRASAKAQREEHLRKAMKRLS